MALWLASNERLFPASSSKTPRAQAWATRLFPEQALALGIQGPVGKGFLGGLSEKSPPSSFWKLISPFFFSKHVIFRMVKTNIIQWHASKTSLSPPQKEQPKLTSNIQLRVWISGWGALSSSERGYTRNTAACGLKLNLTIPEYIQCSMLGEKWL